MKIAVIDTSRPALSERPVADIVAGPPSDERWRVEIEKRIATQRLSANFVATPLSDAIELLAEMMKTPFVIANTVDRAKTSTWHGVNPAGT